MITYFLQCSLCWLFFIAIYRLALKKETFFMNNRWYLLSTLIIGLIFPYLREWWETWDHQAPIEYIVPFQGTAQMLEVNSIYTPEKSFTWWDAVSILYWIGLFVALARLTRDLYAIVRQIIKYPHTQFDQYTQVHTDYEHLPFSFFNYVFISDKLRFKDPEWQRILTHEISHVRGIHSLDIIFIEAISIIFWWNPIIYWYKKAIRDTHEYIADAQVLKSTDTEAYGKLLLHSQSGLQLALANHFISSQLKNRINMMLKFQSKPINKWKYLLSLPIVLILIVLFAYRSPEKEKLVTKNFLHNEFMLTHFNDTIHYNNNNNNIYLINGNRATQSEFSKLSPYGISILHIYRDEANIKKYSLATDMNIKTVYNAITKEGIPLWERKENAIDPNQVYNFNDNYLYAHDGKIISKETAERLIMNNSNYVTTLNKTETIAKYNLDDKEGTFEIHLLSKPDPNDPFKPTDKVSYVLNGKIVSMAETEEVMQDQIVSVNLIKGKAAVDKYGIEVGEGAIEFITKQKYLVNGVSMKPEVAEDLCDNGQIESRMSRSFGAQKNSLVIIEMKDEQALGKLEKDPNYEMLLRKYNIKRSSIEISQAKDKNKISKSLKDTLPQNVIYLINSERATKNEVEVILPGNIEKINILKDQENIKKYSLITDKNIEGVVSIIVKPLAILDGKIISNMELNKLPPSNIASINVLKGKASIEKYGIKGKYGAVEVISKSSEKLITNQFPETTDYEKSHELFKVVEQMPLFPGCETISNEAERTKCSNGRLLRYIYQNIKYPIEAKNAGIEGNVIVSYIVDHIGNIIEPKIVKEIGGGCGDEVLRVVKSMNNMPEKWTPGKQKSKKVGVLYTLPVAFRLEGKNQLSDVNKEKVLGDVLITTTYPEREIFKVVEESPRFPGCENLQGTLEDKKKCADEKMLEYLYKQIKYPQEAKAAGVQGRVVLTFVIEKDGSITDAKIIRNIGGGCGEEALRVINTMNTMPEKWIPGKQRGEKVAVQYNIPIQFKMDDKIHQSNTVESNTKTINTKPIESVSNELKDKNLLQLIPNPASKNVDIAYHQSKNIKIEILDIGGRMIHQIHYNSFDGRHSLDISKFGSGTYFVRLMENGKVYEQKLVVSQ